jgi:hypothetical protein
MKDLVLLSTLFHPNISYHSGNENYKTSRQTKTYPYNKTSKTNLSICSPSRNLSDQLAREMRRAGSKQLHGLHGLASEKLTPERGRDVKV